MGTPATTVPPDPAPAPTVTGPNGVPAPGITQDQYSQIMGKANANPFINGTPKAPTFTGITDKDGNLDPKFKLSDGTGYAGIANAANQQGATNASNVAAQSNMGAQANARTALATRGGLSGGAALRLAETGQQNLANNRQDIQNTMMKNANDIQSKQFDITRQAEQGNIGNLVSNQSALNAFNLGQYKDQMQAWAADKSANAQAAAANSGGKK